MFSDQVINAISKDGSSLGYALELLFPEPTRVHSGVGQLLINDQIYYGTGELGSVGVVESMSDEKPTRVSLELSGIPSDLLNEALQARARGVTCNLYILTTNDKTGLVNYAELLMSGFIISYQVSAGDDNAISIEVSDEFELYEVPWNEYWTDESHTLTQPNDFICRYVAQISEREISWGSKRDAPPFIYN